MTPAEAKQAVLTMNEPKQKKNNKKSNYFIVSYLEIINELSCEPTHHTIHLMFIWIILYINDWTRCWWSFVVLNLTLNLYRYLCII